MKLSGVVIVKNEEKEIGKCIDRLEFCDEVIVIDDFSTDNTSRVAKSKEARLFKRHLKGDYASQRNFALRKAKGEWVLFIDADEVVSPKLAREIRKVIAQDYYDGYYLRRLNVLLRREMRHAGFTKLVRLAKRNSGKWERAVHEVWKVKGKVGVLDNYLIHNSHASISDFVEKISRYFPIHAKENIKEGKASSISKVIVLPFAKFIYNYILRRGFMDGVHGFVVAVLLSFHSYAAWSTIWLEKNSSKN